MGRDAVQDQIAGIFARNDVPYATNDGGTYRVLRGSTAVFVDVIGDDDSGTVVTFQAPLVEELNLEGEAFGKAHFIVNDLNCRSTFGRYCLYADDSMIMLEHEILGGNMQASELLEVLYMVSGSADDWDDAVTEALGGKTYEAASSEPHIVET